jgi:hypothetical protein
MIALYDFQVVSEPQGANLYIDNELIGKTPYRGEHTAGQHTIRLMKKNYVDYERQVNLTRAGKLTAKLELTPEYLARIRQSQEQKKEKTKKPEIEPETAEGGSSTWLWIGVGVAAVGGAAVLLLGGSDSGSGNGEVVALPDPPGHPSN